MISLAPEGEVPAEKRDATASKISVIGKRLAAGIRILNSPPRVSLPTVRLEAPSACPSDAEMIMHWNRLEANPMIMGQTSQADLPILAAR